MVTIPSRFADSINTALHEACRLDKKVFVIGEDIHDPSGGTFRITKGLSTKYPAQVIPTPICESSIVGLGIGMAIRGMLPVVEIMFGDFLTLCADQIINHAAKYPWVFNGQISLPLVIRSPMGGRRGYGPTHSQTLEAIFLNIPHIKIIAPSHFHNPGQLLTNVIRSEGVVTIFVENKLLYPVNLLESGRHPTYHSRVISESATSYPTVIVDIPGDQDPDAVMVCYGGMAPIGFAAQQQLFTEDELRLRLVIPSQIKPLPMTNIILSIDSCRRILIAEEGYGTNGWGAELSAQLYERLLQDLSHPIRRIASLDYPIPTAKPLEEEVLPSKNDIIHGVIDLIEKGF